MENSDKPQSPESFICAGLNSPYRVTSLLSGISTHCVRPTKLPKLASAKCNINSLSRRQQKICTIYSATELVLSMVDAYIPPLASFPGGWLDMTRITFLATGLIVALSGRPLLAQELPKLPATPSEGNPRAADGSDRLKQFQAELEALKKARAEAAASAAAGADASQEERARLKTRIYELTERLKVKENSLPSRPAVTSDPAKNDSAADLSRPIDRLRLVHSLLRTGEAQAALRSLQLIEQASLNAKEAVLLQYMTASCYRRLGRLDKAKETYQGIAGSKEDAFLAECAAWQLRSIEIREGLTGLPDTTPANGNSK